MSEEPNKDFNDLSNAESTGNSEEFAMGQTTDSANPKSTVNSDNPIIEAVEIAADNSDVESEIDQDNAEDAEDTDNVTRHEIPFLDYNSLSLENLVGELQRLLRNEKVQAIKKHVDALKQEFDQKFQEFLEQKKEEFLERGGAEIDFQYNSVTKREFNELYAEYREKRNEYYKNLEQNLLKNLESRNQIIEAIKSLVNMEEDMNSTYKTFKELQERWRSAGPIPRASYNDIWRTYQHHVEIFYDFLNLNRELRDLDFRHNLEEKEKLVRRAEILVEEPDLNKAFRELQTLHKIWKEELGPVSREHREAIWERFSYATKVLHQRKQDHLQALDARYESNLIAKQDLIKAIENLTANLVNDHKNLQLRTKELEALRDQFFKIGKVPQKDNEAIWNSFKLASRKFNRAKNSFYRNQKKEQQENLEKKRALLERAKALQDSDQWDIATPEMRQIQHEWKEIGHVPHKVSDKIWKQFKSCCNAYFDRYNAHRNHDQNLERDSFQKASAILDAIKAFTLSGDREKDFKKIQEFSDAWKAIKSLPTHKRHLNSRFQKIVDALLRKLGMDKGQAEIMQYGDRLNQLEGTDNNRVIEHERQIIRKKIEEYKAEIMQLENNLQFFSNQSTENPLYQEVANTISKKQEHLDEWLEKLKALNIMRNNLKREIEAENSNEE